MLTLLGKYNLSDKATCQAEGKKTSASSFQQTEQTSSRLLFCQYDPVTESPLHSSATTSHPNRQILAIARLDNTAELQHTFQLPYTPFPDEQKLIIQAYQRWGEDCVQHLHGAFIFAIWDSRKQHLFCARDRMGTYPFFYYQSPSKFVFSNQMNFLVRHCQEELTSNAEWIVDHLCNIWFDKNATFYNEIQRLPPAYTLTISAKKFSIRRYWDFDLYKETHLASDKEYIDVARKHFQTAVKRCLRPPYTIGLVLCKS
ncbi:MAG: hypothetical protein D3917_15025 [Candidatus Electrothrix sp. AX5]|nr:hypothetical protein [Candidatus Electrothrix sp. AX5]